MILALRGGKKRRTTYNAAMIEHLRSLTLSLRTAADGYVDTPRWPSACMQALGDAGAWRWALPAAYGGDGLAYADLLRGYAAVAAGDLSTALILTQRDSACDLVARGENDALKEELREHAAGARMTSVGIAQLTTSHGAAGPKLRAVPDGDDLRLEGEMPWVTGALYCDEIVAGAVLPDGRQVLATAALESRGLQVESPLPLLALESSVTSRVLCQGVRVPRERLVRAPSESALSRRAPVKGLTVSAVGLGHADALVEFLQEHAERADGPVAAALRRHVEEAARVRTAFFAFADGVEDRRSEIPAEELRVAVNDLVARLGVAVVVAGKGSGFVRPSLGERLAREALFFQVWSAPESVRSGTLERLLPSTAE